MKINSKKSVFNMEGHGLAVQHRIESLADRLYRTTHFNLAECRALIQLHSKIDTSGSLDRLKMSEILHIVFQITDGVMLELVYKAFDRDMDLHVDAIEWVQGLSIMLRGSTEELSDWCYFVYDINGDGGLAREELSHCLKGCILPGYGVDPDEIEECERDIVEIAMKKLDLDLDGQISIGDFKKAVKKDPLLLTAVGPCLPPVRCCAAFLALVTENFRDYTGALGNKRKSKGKLLTINRPSQSLSDMSDGSDEFTSENFLLA